MTEYAAAKAAWEAAGKPRDAGNPIWERALAATRARAAKNKAQPVAVDYDKLAGLMQRQQANANTDMAARAARQNLRVIRQAYAWPRCGQDFPAGAAEKTANAWAIQAHGSLEAAMSKHGVYS